MKLSKADVARLVPGATLTAVGVLSLVRMIGELPSVWRAVSAIHPTIYNLEAPAAVVSVAFVLWLLWIWAGPGLIVAAVWMWGFAPAHGRFRLARVAVVAVLAGVGLWSVVSTAWSWLDAGPRPGIEDMVMRFGSGALVGGLWLLTRAWSRLAVAA